MFQVPVVKQECYWHTNGFILSKGSLASLLKYLASNSELVILNKIIFLKVDYFSLGFRNVYIKI